MAEKNQVEIWIGQFKKGDKTVFSKLLKAYDGYIRQRSSAYTGVRGLDSETLYWDGAIGLHKALKAYDVKSGKKFAPYAKASIRNSILNTVRKENKTAEARLSSMGYQIVYVDDEVQEDDDTLWAEVIPDPNALDISDDVFIPDEELREEEDFEDLRHLSDNARAFLDYRFGLFNSESHSLAQTARHYGVSTNEACKMLYSALIEHFGTPEHLARRIGVYLGDDPDAIRAGFRTKFKAIPASIREKLMKLELARIEKRAKEEAEMERIKVTYNLNRLRNEVCSDPPRDSA